MNPLNIWNIRNPNFNKMSLERLSFMTSKEGRETVFIRNAGHPKDMFNDLVRKNVNGLLNSHGEVIYVGVVPDRNIVGLRINRKGEEDFRLSVDHTIGSFMPFVSAKVLIILKYKESIERDEEVKKYCTPYLAAARVTEEVKYLRKQGTFVEKKTNSRKQIPARILWTKGIYSGQKSLFLTLPEF